VFLNEGGHISFPRPWHFETSPLISDVSAGRHESRDRGSDDDLLIVGHVVHNRRDSSTLSPRPRVLGDEVFGLVRERLPPVGQAVSVVGGFGLLLKGPWVDRRCFDRAACCRGTSQGLLIVSVA